MQNGPEPDAPPIPTESVDDMVTDDAEPMGNTQENRTTEIPSESSVPVDANLQHTCALPADMTDEDLSNAETASETLSVVEPENAAKCEWIDALVNDPPSTGCTLDAAMHAAALEPGKRVSVRLPNVSRLVGLSNSFIADDEPTGATFVQLLTGAELWPVPELSFIQSNVDPENIAPLAAEIAVAPAAEIAVAPAGNKLPSKAGERFITRMCAYPLLKKAGMPNATTQRPNDIESLVAPYLTSLNPNEQICPKETGRGTCNDADCGFQHMSKGDSTKALTARLLDCFPENDREALARDGATAEAMLQHLTLQGGPPRLDSLANASARRWHIGSSQKSVYELRKLGRELAEFVRLPGTTSYAAQLLLQKRVSSLPDETVVERALKAMTLDSNGRLDERSDKALDEIRDTVIKSASSLVWWHIYVDLSLLRIPPRDIARQRALLAKALKVCVQRSPVLWWKALAIERHSSLETQLDVVRRMADALLDASEKKFHKRPNQKSRAASNYKSALGTVHAANVIYATQRLVGQLAGPAAAIRYLCALFAASTEGAVRHILDQDPLTVGRDDAVKCGAPFKCDVLLFLLKPRFAVLLATALAHWMAYGSALPVDGVSQLGGAFPVQAPLVLLPPVAFPRVLRSVAVFQEIARKVAEKPDELKKWLDNGALMAVTLNMVRCGWLHQSNEPIEWLFERIGDVMEDSIAYLVALQRGSPEASDSAFALLAGEYASDAEPIRIFRYERGCMRLWHMVRTVLQHETRRRVAGGPDAAASWENALKSFSAILARIVSATSVVKASVNWSSAGCAVTYLLETLLKGADVNWAGVPDIFNSDPPTFLNSCLETPLMQAHIAMELVATMRGPGRAPAGALLVLGRMLQYSAASKRDEYEATGFIGAMPKRRRRQEWLSVPQFHDLYHIVARRYFEYALPFSIACASKGQPTTPRDGIVDCRASCAACESALAMTQVHREVLLFGADTAPIELVAESCERLLFEAMSHSGVIIEAVGV